MPQIVTDADTIFHLLVAKQRNEARLAEATYSLFNVEPHINTLRELVRLIMKTMGQGDDSIFKKTITKEPDLRVWKKVNKNKGKFAFFALDPKQLSVLDATDCADIIRLAGEWVEQGGIAAPGFTGTGPTDAYGQRKGYSDQVKDAFRPGVTADRFQPGQKTNLQKIPDQWKQQVNRVWSDAGGPEMKSKFVGMPPSRIRGNENVPNNTTKVMDPKRLEEHLRQYARDPNAYAGMKVKRAQCQSNMLKIDRLFGLTIGADISGTTTDTAFAMEVWGYNILTAVYYLAPFATIVHNNHHTLLEVATALSLNGIINYQIGQYSSLLPTDNDDKTGLVAQLENLFSLAESHSDNQHFLCFYKDNLAVPAGCILFDKSDVMQLREKKWFSATSWLDKAPEISSFSLESVQKLIPSDIKEAVPV